MAVKYKSALTGPEIDMALSHVDAYVQQQVPTFMQKGVDYVTAGKLSGSTLGTRATAEGRNVTASGQYAHAEGAYTLATGANTHAEGNTTSATAVNDHAEGYRSTASGGSSHAEGNGSTASGGAAHAEGNATTASGEASHAEGTVSTASGNSSHAEGYGAEANGNYSHAEGYNTIAEGANQHVGGRYNVPDSTSLEIIGNGSDNSARSNARLLDAQGNETLAGKLTLGAEGTDDMDAATVGQSVKAALAAYVTDTAEGSIASFSDGADNIPVKSLSATITPKQSGSGDPSPSNIRPISGYTGATIYDDAYYGGLIDWNQRFSMNSSVVSAGVTATYDSATGQVSFSGTSTGTSYINTNTVSVKDHVYLADCGTDTIRYWLYNDNGGVNTHDVRQTVGKATAANRFYIRINGGVNVSGLTARPQIYDLTQMFGADVADYILSLEQGEAGAGVSYFKEIFPKDYYPYTTGGTMTTAGAVNGDAGQTILLDFGQTVYAGTITYIGDGQYKIQPTHAMLANPETLTYTQYTAWGSDHTYSFAVSGIATTGAIYCNKYGQGTQSDIFGGTAAGWYFRSDISAMYISDPSYTTAAAFKASMADTQILYPLATLPDPIIVDGSEVRSLLGDNNIWSDTGSVDVEYRADTKLYIAKVIGGGNMALSMAAPTLASPSELIMVDIPTEIEDAPTETPTEEE